MLNIPPPEAESTMISGRGGIILNRCGHSYYVKKCKRTLPDLIILNQNNPNFLIDQNNDEHQDFVPWYLTCTSSLCIGRAYYKVLVNSDRRIGFQMMPNKGIYNVYLYLYDYLM